MSMDNQEYYDEETEEFVIKLSMEERQAIAKKVRERLYGKDEE